MNVDLELCGKLLNKLSESFPYAALSEDIDEMTILAGNDEEALITNLLYLEQHYLVKSGISININRHKMFRGETKITAKGLDFIRKDGGLTAMLERSNVNYQLHEALLSELLRQIHEAPDSSREKEGLVAQLRGLPAETIKHLYMKLLDQGVSHLPGVIPLIQKFLQQD